MGEGAPTQDGCGNQSRVVMLSVVHLWHMTEKLIQRYSGQGKLIFQHNQEATVSYLIEEFQGYDGAFPTFRDTRGRISHGPRFFKEVRGRCPEVTGRRTRGSRPRLHPRSSPGRSGHSAYCHRQLGVLVSWEHSCPMIPRPAA
jgi:hypothetical protein